MNQTEELEIGRELEQALRAAVVGVAQVWEQLARRAAARDQATAAELRATWLAQRDTARAQYAPWTRPGAVEHGEPVQASRAWARAAGWSTQDPQARSAAPELWERISKTHGQDPAAILRQARGTQTPGAQDPGRVPQPTFTMREAKTLADQRAPYYYQRHQDLDLAALGDQPASPHQQQVYDDWKTWAEDGDLPQRALREEWARYTGHTEDFDPQRWSDAQGVVRHDDRDGALERHWDEGAEQRDLHQLEEHLSQMAYEEMPADQVRRVTRPLDGPAAHAPQSYQELLDPALFAAANDTLALAAWEEASRHSPTEPAAATAAAQFETQLTTRWGRSPQSYLQDLLADRASNRADAQRSQTTSGPSSAISSTVRGSAAAESTRPAPAQPAPAPGTQRPAPVAGQAHPGTTAGRIVELNTAAKDWYAAQLRPGTPGHAYLVDRLGEQEVSTGRWDLGYAPPGWTHLSAHLRANGATDSELVDAGLGQISSRGNLIDTFRDRAMFAVRDPAGQIVGFTGRDLSGARNAPKYLNTAQTAAFSKGQLLYGLDQADPAARLVRVEGPLDAIAVTAAGDGQLAGVAPLGTALSAAQGDLLAARSPDHRVWLLNDNDEPGRQATVRDFWVLAERGLDARELILPNGSDPAAAWQDNPAQLQADLSYPDQAPTAAISAVDQLITEHHDGLLAGDADAHEHIARTLDAVTEVVPEADANITRLHVASRLVDLAPHQDEPRPVYDRAAESDLANLPPAARQARIDSGHTFSQSTRDMLAQAQHKPGRAARRRATPGVQADRTLGQQR